jgi:hypothetical protein
LELKNQRLSQFTLGNGGHISAMLNAWAFKYNLIRDLTGINPARDGSLSQDALLG